MKIRSYLKEKLYVIVLTLFLSILSVLFLRAVACNSQIICIVVFFFWVLGASVLLVEFLRRRSYYNNILSVLDGLDKKYLLAEVLPEPNFQDGRILYDVMRQVNKNMLDHINVYKFREEEYKDYIEMWVHEIKTPLAASKLILNNNPGVVSVSVEEELDKVEAFVEQALFYARSTTLEKDYLIKKMDLKTSINKVIRKHSKTFIYHKIKLQLDEIEEQVYSDPKWLEFILEQIISNALKYTAKETGSIYISAKMQGDKLALMIKDNGVGIPMSDLKRIFDKGFTGRNGRRNEKATGMGLYLCKLLCDKLYLGIQASSQEGLGTTITILFPMSSMMLLK